MELANLVRATTIAQRLGVVRSVINRWEGRYTDFPQPAHTIDGVKFWDWPTVRRWHAAREDAK